MKKITILSIICFNYLLAQDLIQDIIQKNINNIYKIKLKNNSNLIKEKEEDLDEYYKSDEYFHKMEKIDNIINRWKKTKKIDNIIIYDNKKYTVLYNQKEIIIKNIPLDFAIYFSNKYIIENNIMYIPLSY